MIGILVSFLLGGLFSGALLVSWMVFSLSDTLDVAQQIYDLEVAIYLDIPGFLDLPVWVPNGYVTGCQ